MKGLVLLFLCIAIGGIGWRYADRQSRRAISNAFSKNLMAVLLALAAVAIAVFFSINTTLRLV